MQELRIGNAIHVFRAKSGGEVAHALGNEVKTYRRLEGISEMWAEVCFALIIRFR